MKHTIRLSIFFCAFAQSLTAQQTKVLLNAKGQTVDSPADAVYYRIIRKVRSQYHIQDFLMSHQIKFEAYALNSENPLLLNDTMKSYYKNGKLKSCYFYKNGKQHGWNYSYYPNGQEKIRIHYKQDTLDGDYSSFYPWGGLRIHCTYRNDQIIGKYQSYFFNGNIELEQEIFDPLNIDITEYDWKGNLKSKNNMRNGHTLYDTLIKNYAQKEIKKHSDKKSTISKNCVQLETGEKAIELCSKKINHFSIHVITSNRFENITEYIRKRSISDQEIYFLYSPESKLMAWRMSPSLKDAFRSSILSYYTIVGILESDFFAASSFYSSIAVDELFKEFNTGAE